MSTIPSVLIISTNPSHQDQAADIVRRMGLHPVKCATLTDARSLVEHDRFEVVLCADDLPDCNLATAIRVISATTSGAPVVVLSRLADWDAYMHALRAGAFDYIACPPNSVESERILRMALSAKPAVHRPSRTAA
jgi:DNA-binding NtrC family response regulator